MKRITRQEIEDTDDFDDLCLVARKLGYRGIGDQLIIGNGAAVSDLIAFFEDNPGAVQAVAEWIIDEGSHADGTAIEDHEEEDEGDS